MSASGPAAEAYLVQPPLTVLMPARNAQSTVGSTIDDLLGDVGPHDEVLIVDDGSEDRTPAILANAAERDERVRVIRTPGLGLVGALNLGLIEAQHRYIARADADDRYPRGRLDAQRAAFSPGVVLVSGDYSIWSDGRQLGVITTALGDPFVALSLVNPQRIPHPGVAFDRDAVLSVGGYRHEEFPAEDLGLWLRLMSVGAFMGVPKPVCAWTMARMSTSHQRQEQQRATVGAMLSAVNWNALRDRVLVGLKVELASYKSAPQGRERALLLFRDVEKAFGFRFATRCFLSAGRSAPLQALDALSSLPGLAVHRYRRRSLRSSWANARSAGALK